VRAAEGYGHVIAADHADDVFSDLPGEPLPDVERAGVPLGDATELRQAHDLSGGHVSGVTGGFWMNRPARNWASSSEVGSKGRISCRLWWSSSVPKNSLEGASAPKSVTKPGSSRQEA
jgi:hypothetical protein